jgi:hypothetical protein
MMLEGAEFRAATGRRQTNVDDQKRLRAVLSPLADLSLRPMQHPCRHERDEEDEGDNEKAILEGERVRLDGNDLAEEL